ncbi:DUF4252 domain-containing protein [Rubrivirga sp. IMCC45206]|uniref:DUF4252 domain-containing protein n=1 Tax=Rubrivirga sp. IMCC45206 TaxID=3391614 RepID=UPI0039901A23
MTSSRLLALALAMGLGLSGCVSIEMGRAKREVAAEIERTGDATVGRGFAVAFGRGTIGSSRFLTRLVAPSATEPYRRISSHVRQIKVARAPIEGTVDALAIQRPSFLTDYERDGWIPLVTARDSSEAVWVMTREREDGPITDLVAVVVGDGELMVTRLRGDLSALVLDALAYGSESDLFGDTFSEGGFFGPPEADAPDTTDARP